MPVTFWFEILGNNYEQKIRVALNFTSLHQKSKNVAGDFHKLNVIFICQNKCTFIKLIFCVTSYFVEIKRNLSAFLRIRFPTFEKIFPIIRIKFPSSYSLNAMVGEALLMVLHQTAMKSYTNLVSGFDIIINCFLEKIQIFQKSVVC